MAETTEQLAVRFAECAPELRDWAEKAAYENLKTRLQVGDLAAAQAGNTLTLLLAGVGGALAYALPLFDGRMKPVTVAAAVVCLYLAVLAGLVLVKCLMLTGVPTVYNEPANLLQPGYSHADVQAGELANLQERIGEVKARNRARAWWLNRLRAAAVATPFVFAAAAAALATVLTP